MRPSRIAVAARPALLAVICSALVASVCSALAADLARAEGWHSAQPPAPPAPEGQSGVRAPIPLGHIGDIEFWAPNRGLLITAGNDAIPAGLYYYNGLAWRELSNVCGGADGRIAWAGPDEFWTISDQPAGQQLGIASSAHTAPDRSLCHFKDGAVVASYAEPIGLAESYEQMDAATCSGPEDCWFAGERLGGNPNRGAFHLHWNGSALSPVPSLLEPQPQLEDPGRAVAHLVSFKGRIYESVQVSGDDQPAPSESAAQPFLLHRIVEGLSQPFEPLSIEGPSLETSGERAPFSYGSPEALPEELSAFAFAATGGALWAIAGPVEGATHATVTALRLRGGSFEQVALKDPSGALAPDEAIGGLAAEPGSEDAWVSLEQPRPSAQDSAVVARILPDGTVEPAESLPEDSEVGHKGAAEAIACPAPGDCWVATSGGWLFHRGGAYPEDRDPAFGSLITYRPPDASIPFVAPETFPEDDSLANQQPGSTTAPVLPPPPTPALPQRAKALLEHVKSHFHHHTLLLSFTLTASARVQLIARAHRRIVAKTRREALHPGRHTLSLTFNPKRWPKALQFKATPLQSSASAQAGS
ncbi:MAG: hypothetical protein FWD42_09365 [Solirubrobacterales bacterium]|nr:hypothetical protein [Solirubrobacterales bacterium]